MLLGIDPLYWVMMIPIFIFSAITSFRVKSVFNKYSDQETSSGMTGADVAREILRRNGLQHIEVKEVSGFFKPSFFLKMY